MFVTVGSSGVNAKSKGVHGEEFLTLLHEHMIPACEALMAKGPRSRRNIGGFSSKITLKLMLARRLGIGFRDNPAFE